MKTNVKKIVSEMTLEEKASLCGGEDFWHTKAVGRLGIPSVMLSDGPHGLRTQRGDGDHLGINDSIKAVCFPAACATAASFDTELLYELGETIGNECQAVDVSTVLGPAVNIKRSPLCGRNFEYFSEDPYLAGKMAASYINGVQSKHVGTSLKHFALNNQEYYRMSNNSVASMRTMREIYLTPFEIAVKESSPKTVMCSYNKINGTYAADNKWLLNDVLREEWGFQGYVVTDWGAVNDRVKGIKAGLELEMPGNTAENDSYIVKAVKEGALDEALLDQAVSRILTVIYDYLDNRNPEAVFDLEEDHKKAEAVEAECAVLLENNGVLPLKDAQKVVYIGEYAVSPRYQGGGSSHINSSKVTSAYETSLGKKRNVTYVKGFSGSEDVLEEKELRKAVEAAKEADVAVIFAGLPESFESEGYDRKNMDMPSCQNILIEEVAKVNQNTVVVLHNGSPVETPWADKVAAILEMYLGGQGVGTVTDQILYGEVNPSGHLAESFPLRVQDNPSFLNFNSDSETCNYAEGIYVGYRYYDKKEIPVRWAFGHGLSYTTFSMGNIRVSNERMTDDTKIEVSVDVKNTGNMTGKEVVQLYISDKNHTSDRPVKELKGFTKVLLAPGEQKTVHFILDARSLSYYEEKLNDWFAPSGKYEILLGDASDHILASTVIEYKTNRRKPLRLDTSVTMGELLADEVTRPIILQMMEGMKEKVPVDLENEDGKTDPMSMAMFHYMPLKSLKSFGVMNDKQIQEVIDEIRRRTESIISGIS